MALLPVGKPKGWGEDTLTAYLEDFRDNQFASFDSKKPAVGDLIKIDGLFVRLLHQAVNPRPYIPAFFMLRAHAAYRAGAGAVMAGQVYEAQAMLRLCLEHASYGFYINGDAERWGRWMSRMESDAAKKLVREEFSHGRIRRHIEQEAPQIGAVFSALYERLIDFGAHPNEQGFSLNSGIREEGEHVHFDTVYLHGDGLPLDVGLRGAAQIGLCVLHLMQLIYRERYELLGIRAELDGMRTRFGRSG